MSKSLLQHYYVHILLPNKHRIKSLHLSNPFTVDFILSSSNFLSKLNRLETFIIDHVESKCLEELLNHLICLPNLSSLTITSIDKIDHPNNLYIQILRLPVLKYCKVSFDEDYRFEPLTMATNEYSSIEHLVIERGIRLEVLHRLLSYVPQLCRLSCQSLIGYDNLSTEINISMKNLTHASLDLCHVRFNQLECLIMNYFHKIQVLHISGKASLEDLDANRWKQLILSHMPYLRVFVIRFIYHPGIMYNQLTYDSLFNQFNSQFWFERKWFFDYRHCSKYGRRDGIFYSINPYKGKDYRLVGKMNENTRLYHQETNLNSVRHVYIYGEQIMNDCVNYFSNSTYLTLYDSFSSRTRSFTSILNHIVPLQQLTKVVIDSHSFSFQKLCELLRSAPKINSLIINSAILSETSSVSMRQSETFRSVSNTNNITNVTIKDKSELVDKL
ncbi:unnamed protein product [Rotaria sp. Silwood2]|nr:unnamed protein product [Rotaria sp. Silwood2]